MSSGPASVRLSVGIFERYALRLSACCLFIAVVIIKQTLYSARDVDEARSAR